MRKFILAACLSIVLAGCATTSGNGNYLATATETEQQAIAQEAAKQLATMWPPGRTRFVIAQDTKNPFGTALSKAIRETGYALEEAQPTTESTIQAATPPKPASNAIPLAYIVDQVDSSIIRLSMNVGTQTITRPYVIQDGKAIPAGNWTRKE